MLINGITGQLRTPRWCQTTCRKKPRKGVLHLMSQVHTSRFGIIPKGHQPGKWCLILDLSFPNGASINSGISIEFCSLQYVTVVHAATIISELGVGIQMVKIDTFRNVPDYPQDPPLLGINLHAQIHWWLNCKRATKKRELLLPTAGTCI